MRRFINHFNCIGTGYAFFPKNDSPHGLAFIFHHPPTCLCVPGWEKEYSVFRVEEIPPAPWTAELTEADLHMRELSKEEGDMLWTEWWYLRPG